MRHAKLEFERADGRKRIALLPYEIAWTAARAVARERGYAVTLTGMYGQAHFLGDGGGVVEWLQGSLTPGERTTFTASTTVCI